ncbi:TonB-dependent receptor [Aliifodinibius salipaludis]|uniref:TonB-dependent receptor n=1 Tax=Fodinibius salipaludis TaxID=2032627 RepID=A0A2A2G7F4_9BACT|nr:TonB-dependent receptor [Aliifodinibius salipaludis]PAU92789.1 TonB-dependent receptor [Aliifodinibius salipaludis]
MTSSNKLFCLLSFLGFLLILPPLSNASYSQNSTIEGVVIDKETGDPISYAYLFLEGINRGQTTHSDGTFTFKNIPSGTYTIKMQRIGYKTQSQTIEVPASDTLKITLEMTPTILDNEGVEVFGQHDRGSSNHLENATQNISGQNLRQNLSSTLANTLEDIPGLSTRSMGTAPGRPVMRGLGGERLMILEDGERTGDVSSQSSDHAVSVDPMSAEEIKIARGPSALEYGSNAIGGVINVVRNQVPSSIPDHLHGTASLQGETVNTGSAAGIEFGLPLGSNFSLKADGNLRSTLDTNTPAGTLENSGLFSSNNSIGLGYIKPWGHAGISSNIYLNNYGIPPDSLGGHPNGVDIEMEKFQFKGTSEIILDRPFLQKLEVNLSHKSYFHQEIESSGIVGTEFGVLTTNASIKADHNTFAFFGKGKMGIWAEQKNYAVNGTNTPDSDSYSLSAFLIEEKDIGPLHLEVGARLDHTTAMPDETEHESIQGRQIRDRSFTALATSANAVYDFGDGFFTGASVIHSFRAPSQEELFSQGPHLASYSYEVGNPDLDPERGLGKEIYFRYRKSNARAEITFFHNRFLNYNYATNTGKRRPEFLGGYPIYQFTGTEAVLSGIEFNSQLKLTNHWALSASASYTHGKRKLFENEQTNSSEEWKPLPMIPPFKGNVELSYTYEKLKVGTKTKIAAAQKRTGEFETPTDSYAIFSFFSQYRFEKWALLHTVSLNANNIFNTTYRDHLSRIKEIYPQPGRNISMLYRVYF